MDNKAKLLAIKLTALAQLYINKNKYGNLHSLNGGEFPNFEDEKSYIYILEYYNILGEPCFIAAEYLFDENSFEYVDPVGVNHTSKTGNVDDVVAVFKKLIEKIPHEREIEIILYADYACDMYPADMAARDKSWFPEENGLTLDELVLYQSVCWKIYRKGNISNQTSNPIVGTANGDNLIT